MLTKRVSIIINNHNYAAFLEDAILSALNQSYPNTEVIVIDDGSTDNSTSIIEKYQGQIISHFKTCGGQASALNAGFKKSRGDLIIFLDADDCLLPNAAKKAVKLMQNSDSVKLHWPLWVIDQNGKRTGAIHPNSELPKGDYTMEVIEKGPTILLSPPTSGNAWSREFLLKISPIPEEVFKISADKFLIEIAPFYGPLSSCSEPLSEYRIHGNNAQIIKTTEEQLEKELKYYDNYSSWLINYCNQQGFQIEIDNWKKNSWWHNQKKAIKEISTLRHKTGAVILIDDGLWGSGSIAGIKRNYFLESNGQFAGLPADDEQAIQELNKLRQSGAKYIVFPWHTKWWFKSYSGFYDYLCNHFLIVIDNDYLLGFEL